MGHPDGLSSRTLGPQHGPVLVKTFREGVASRVGHDLVLEATHWNAVIEESAVRVTVDPHSLEVREAHGGVKPLSDHDRREIAKNIDAKVLRGLPITFESTDVHADEVEGDLTIAGRTRRVTLPRDRPLRIRQSDWGITPFRGLMGALRVRDEIEIDVTALL